MQGGMIMGTPTRVVLLRNMVGPGQVDEDLEDEVANECSKYGQVQSVMIFEVTTPGYPDDQAVRIFVEFERMEQATKVCLTATWFCCHAADGFFLRPLLLAAVGNKKKKENSAPEGVFDGFHIDNGVYICQSFQLHFF